MINFLWYDIHIALFKIRFCLNQQNFTTIFCDGNFVKYILFSILNSCIYKEFMYLYIQRRVWFICRLFSSSLHSTLQNTTWSSFKWNEIFLKHTEIQWLIDCSLLWHQNTCLFLEVCSVFKNSYCNSLNYNIGFNCILYFCMFPKYFISFEALAEFSRLCFVRLKIF